MGIIRVASCLRNKRLEKTIIQFLLQEQDMELIWTAEGEEEAIRLLKSRDANVLLVDESDPPERNRQEISILHLIHKGYTQEKVANELFLSSHTVKVHIRNVLRKMNETNSKNVTAKLDELEFFSFHSRV